MRLQTFLSHSGRCSRRKAMDLVKQGCVRVNGKIICEPSFEVEPESHEVYLEGIKVAVKRLDYLILHKPAGVTTTKEDRHAKKTVMDLLPKEFRHLNPVGRLDRDTEGLLLLTNNGELAFRLSHPKFNINKTYFVEVKGQLQEADKFRLEKGIDLEEGRSSPCRIRNVKINAQTSQFEITIHEGKKRQVRLMLAALGYPVLYLKRISFGQLSLGSLPLGKWRRLSEEEISALKK